MEEISIITLIGMICTILSVAMLYFKTINSLDNRLSKIEVKTDTYLKSGLDMRLSKLEVKTELFWGIVEREIPRLIKAPTHKEMDELLDKMTARKLTKNDAIKLKEILEKEINGHNPDKVLACTLLLIRIEQIIIEDVMDKIVGVRRSATHRKSGWA